MRYRNHATAKSKTSMKLGGNEQFDILKTFDGKTSAKVVHFYSKTHLLEQNKN